MFSTKKLKKLGSIHWPNVIRLFSLLFFFFSFSPDSYLSLPLPFIFLYLSPSFFPFTNLAMEIKVWTSSADLHYHLAPPTSWASSPSTARSPLSCCGGADLWSWKRALTRIKREGKQNLSPPQVLCHKIFVFLSTISDLYGFWILDFGFWISLRGLWILMLNFVLILIEFKWVWLHMFRFLSLILVGFVCFYFVLNLDFLGLEKI